MCLASCGSEITAIIIYISLKMKVDKTVNLKDHFHLIRDVSIVQFKNKLKRHGLNGKLRYINNELHYYE